MGERKGVSMFCFAGYRLDSRRRLLQRTDEQGLSSDLRLSSAEALILGELLSRAGEVCSKEQLLSVGWEGKPISPNSLMVAIGNLRRYLLPDPAVVEIRSIPKKGYMLSLFVPLREQMSEALGMTPTLPEVEAPRADIQEAQASAAETLSSTPERQTGAESAAESALSEDVPPAPAATQVATSHRRCHLPHWDFRLALVWINLGVMGLLFALPLLISFEWLHVSCRQQEGISVCILDEKHPFTPEAKVGQAREDTLWLVSGKHASQYSKRELLQSAGTEHDTE